MNYEVKNCGREQEDRPADGSRGALKHDEKGGRFALKSRRKCGHILSPVTDGLLVYALADHRREECFKHMIYPFRDACSKEMYARLATLKQVPR